MADQENVAAAEQSDHAIAAAKHAEKRAAEKARAIAKNKPKKRFGQRPKFTNTSLEPRPGNDGTNYAERTEILAEEMAQRSADTRAALARPSELTPLQLKRLEQSESRKNARKKETGNLPKLGSIPDYAKIAKSARRPKEEDKSE